MNAVQKVKRHLKPGRVYRRLELSQWSNAVDRHIKLLQKDNTLKKLSGGLYYCPKLSAFGQVPPSGHMLVEAFLKDDRFLLMSFNDYNSLGVGTTQLYNESIVYNHKRHGLFKLGARTYRFIMKHHFPNKLSKEFLLVDLVDNIKKLAEDQALILELVKQKAFEFNRQRLCEYAEAYGGVYAKKFFKRIFEEAL